MIFYEFFDICNRKELASGFVYGKISLVPIRLYPICPIKGLDTDFPFSDTPQPHHIKPNPIAKFEY
jgi:hypothetical protein